MYGWCVGVGRWWMGGGRWCMVKAFNLKVVCLHMGGILAYVQYACIWMVL
jgi:hypothetical protein